MTSKPSHVPYSLVQWNWFSGVTGSTWITCIQWGQRANFTAPGCGHKETGSKPDRTSLRTFQSKLWWLWYSTYKPHGSHFGQPHCSIHTAPRTLEGILPSPFIPFSFLSPPPPPPSLSLSLFLSSFFLPIYTENETVFAVRMHSDLFLLSDNGACAHCVMASKYQWKPFWLAAQLYPQNDWTGWQNRVNYDVFAQAPLQSVQETMGNGKNGLVLCVINTSCVNA